MLGSLSCQSLCSRLAGLPPGLLRWKATGGSIKVSQRPLEVESLLSRISSVGVGGVLASWPPSDSTLYFLLL